ncbi:hypothetical protein Pla175_34030 [Pirellulimonas nuda]|uniref:Uncharacterized protein n=1 Tax=Pirellulimonas nuda TaxID=2528009 RepID=A0A518DEU8_9BACT|nr:lipopolysaccharide biosynthesis protein [Pirellulimonas nuda]QDU90004.1 hypothetical protein Pla175_34030 [Pirellulimonas nuda]
MTQTVAANPAVAATLTPQPPAPAPCSSASADYRRDLKMGGLSLADQLVVSGANFLTFVMLSHWCTKQQVGLFALAWTVSGFLRTAQERLISAPYLAFVHRHETDQPSLLGSSLVHQGCFAALCGLAVAAGALAPWSDDLARMPIVFAALAASLPLMMLRDHLRVVCSAHFRFYTEIAMDLLVACTQLSAIVLLAGAGALNAATVTVALGLACLAPSLWWLARRAQPFRIDPARLATDWLTSWRYSRWLVVARSISLGAYQLIPWLVVFYLDTERAGVFAVCSNLVGLSQMFVMGANNYFQPRTIAAMQTQGITAMCRSLLETVLVFTVILSGLTLALYFAGGWLLGAIYGADYAEYGHLTFLIALATLAICVSVGCGNGLAALGKPRGYLWGELAYFAVSIGCAMLLIPRMGLTGAAWSLVAGGVTVSLVTALTLALLVREHLREERWSSTPAEAVE